ncbi:sterol desaturase family protein [Flavihumibacter sediminis]|nr:sterol desaturase family protein [Flavihumibacter sediminis]
MESIIKYIGSIDGNYIIIILIALFYSLEHLLGSPFKFDRRLNHFVNNVLFQLPFFFANLAFAVVQVGIVKWSSANEIGLFHWIELPLWLKVILGVMCLDLSSYWFHRLAHRSPLFWRLHRVHHSDTRMDTSTFFRGHPLEVLVFGTASTVGCIIFGIDLQILGVYLIVQLPFLVAQHANVQLPAWTDKVFGKVFITPNIHKVHHDQNQYYTDSNFADIFVFWDKIFGTYKYSPVASRHYGLKEFDSAKKQTFWYLMISPFITIDRNIEEKPDMPKTVDR